MRAESCRDWRESLGAYALGRLEPGERTALEAHLEGCETCRSELAAISEVAALMPLADLARIEEAPAPPRRLGERVRMRVATEGRRRRRNRRVVLGLSLGGVAAAAAALLIAVLPSGSPEPGQRVDFTGLPGGVRIAATLEPRSFGTEIRMDVSGIRSGTLCRVFLRRRDGTPVSAGSFRYRYGGDYEATLSAALDLSRARAVGVHAGRRTFVEPLGRPARAALPTTPRAKEPAWAQTA
ncbi:MAG: zf-HC2 domain-containing protein [Solirubrobacterales bacterium]